MLGAFVAPLPRRLTETPYNQIPAFLLSLAILLPAFLSGLPPGAYGDAPLPGTWLLVNGLLVIEYWCFPGAWLLVIGAFVAPLPWRLTETPYNHTSCFPQRPPKGMAQFLLKTMVE